MDGELVVETPQRGNRFVVKWTARHVGYLDRTNKISSSVFSVVQAATNATYHFQILLLRGVERGADASMDPVGVYLQLLDDAVELNCHVTIAVLRWTPDRRDDDATSSRDGGSTVVVAQKSEIFPFSPSSRSFGFPALITVELMRDLFSVGGDGVLLRAEMELGVVSIADAVHGVASSVFSTLRWGASAVASRFGQLQRVLEERVERFDEASETSLPPWESLPPMWASRQAAWKQLLCEHLPEDEYTFLVGPPTSFTTEVQLHVRRVGLSPRKLLAAVSLVDVEKEVHEGFLSCEALRRQRFCLVPASLSDDSFWLHYLWKVKILAETTTNEQVQILLSILNAPAPSCKKNEPADGGNGVATPLKEAAEARAVLTELLNDGAAESNLVMKASAVAACEVQRSNLQELFQKISGEDATRAELAAEIEALQAVEARASEGRNAQARDATEAESAALSKEEETPSLIAEGTAAATPPSNLNSSSFSPSLVAHAENAEKTVTLVENEEKDLSRQTDGVPLALAIPPCDVPQVSSRCQSAESPVLKVSSGGQTSVELNAEKSQRAKDYVEASLSPEARRSSGNFAVMPWEEED